MDAEIRRADLTRGAVIVARRVGLARLTHIAVANECRTSTRTVYRWCGNRSKLRRRVIEHAKSSGFMDLLDDVKSLGL